jgi:hypothetical protein
MYANFQANYNKQATSLDAVAMSPHSLSAECNKSYTTVTQQYQLHKLYAFIAS